MTPEQWILIVLLFFYDRGVYDVKATDMGVDTIRFKAEVDFDGREVTRSYLDKQDLESLLKVWRKKK